MNAIMPYYDTPILGVHYEQNSEISNSQSRPIRSTLTLHPREEHPHMDFLKASTSKPKPITQDALMNMMHQKTNAGIKRTLHVRLICMLSLSIMRPLPPRTISSHMPRLEVMVTRHLPSMTRTLGLQILFSTSTCALALAYVAHLRSTRCLCSTLGLILVPLTHTRVWRNKLYPFLSHS